MYPAYTDVSYGPSPLGCVTAAAFFGVVLNEAEVEKVEEVKINEAEVVVDEV